MKIELHRLKVPVAVEIETQLIEFAETSFTLAEWKAWVERVNKLLIRLNLLPKPKPEGGRSIVGKPFFVHNLDAINKQKRGKIKKAPWWLRWKYDAVITKEELSDRY